MLLDRKQLLKKEDLKKEKVDLGNDEFVYVRQMTGHERDNFEQSLIKEKTDFKGNVTYQRSLSDFRAKLAVCTLCKENGDALLSSDDYVILSKNMSAARLEKIITIAQKLNKITEEDKEALVKNSKGGQAANSNSDSAKS